MLEDRQLPLEQKKRKILRNLRTLEQAGLVSSKHKYQEVINDISKVRLYWSQSGAGTIWKDVGACWKVIIVYWTNIVIMIALFCIKSSCELVPLGLQGTINTFHYVMSVSLTVFLQYSDCIHKKVLFGRTFDTSGATGRGGKQSWWSCSRLWLRSTQRQLSIRNRSITMTHTSKHVWITSTESEWRYMWSSCTNALMIMCLLIIT